MKNKILTISIIFILLSFIFINNNVFAASYDLNDYKNHISDDNWCIVYSEINNTFYLIKTSSTNYPIIMFHGITVEDGKYICGSGEITVTSSVSNPYQSQGNYVVYTYNLETSKFIQTGSYNPSNHFIAGTCEIIASGRTIYSSWNTSIFFQQTPVPSMVYIQPLTLAEELEKVQVKENFQIMIRGIIPYLIALVIGLVAFWKAWQLLLKELRKA